MIEGLRVRIPAGAAGEFSSPKLAVCTDSYSVFSSPELTLCADSYYGVSSTPVLLQWHVKTLVILPKVQVAGYA